jgi:hypothetical protein
MATAPTVGLDCKLYYNSATHATPTWVLIDDAIDVSFEYGTNIVEIKSRASVNLGSLAGLIKHGGTFSMLHTKGTNTVRAALLGIISGRVAKELAFKDQAIATSGALGARFYANLESMNMNQPLEEGAVWDITAKPAHFIESSAKVEPDIYIVSP